VVWTWTTYNSNLFVCRLYCAEWILWLLFDLVHFSCCPIHGVESKTDGLYSVRQQRQVAFIPKRCIRNNLMGGLKKHPQIIRNGKIMGIRRAVWRSSPAPNRLGNWRSLGCITYSVRFVLLTDKTKMINFCCCRRPKSDCWAFRCPGYLSSRFILIRSVSVRPKGY
jgi:hypothetical protein